MDLSHLPRRELHTARISILTIGNEEPYVPAKLFDTLTFLPSFCPSNTPTTRFRTPLPERPKWSAAERRTRGATETLRVTRERVSAVVAGMVVD